MPYNPGGIFSLIASYFASPGTTIRTEQHNPVFEDVASALSSVLLRDGRAPMTGPLNMNGQEINNVATGNTPTSVATLAQAMPIGAVIDYALKTPPAGWLVCASQILLSTTPYTTLRNLLIADAFPFGQDGSGNPKLPDARGCVTAGYDSMGGAPGNRLPADFGSIIGERSVTLNATHLPNLNLTLSGTPGLVAVTTVSSGILSLSGGDTPAKRATAGSSFNTIDIANDNPVKGFIGSTGTFTPQGTVYNGGGDQPHNNAQPTLILNKIIRVSYDG